MFVHECINERILRACRSRNQKIEPNFFPFLPQISPDFSEMTSKPAYAQAVPTGIPAATIVYNFISAAEQTYLISVSLPLRLPTARGSLCELCAEIGVESRRDRPESKYQRVERVERKTVRRSFPTAEPSLMLSDDADRCTGVRDAEFAEHKKYAN